MRVRLITSGCCYFTGFASRFIGRELLYRGADARHDWAIRASTSATGQFERHFKREATLM